MTILDFAQNALSPRSRKPESTLYRIVFFKISFNFSFQFSTWNIPLGSRVRTKIFGSKSKFSAIFSISSSSQNRIVLITGIFLLQSSEASIELTGAHRLLHSWRLRLKFRSIFFFSFFIRIILLHNKIL